MLWHSGSRLEKVMFYLFHFLYSTNSGAIVPPRPLYAGAGRCHLSLESCQKSRAWKLGFRLEWSTNPTGQGHLKLDSVSPFGRCVTFGPTCLSFCYLYSITLLGFLLITSSPSSKAYKSRMSQWLIFLGSSIRQSLEPNSSATGPRLPSCSEHGRAFSCNNRTGFRT